jgi:hypothetical protein
MRPLCTPTDYWLAGVHGRALAEYIKGVPSPNERAATSSLSCPVYTHKLSKSCKGLRSMALPCYNAQELPRQVPLSTDGASMEASSRLLTYLT